MVRDPLLVSARMLQKFEAGGSLGAFDLPTKEERPKLDAQRTLKRVHQVFEKLGYTRTADNATNRCLGILWYKPSSNGHTARQLHAALRKNGIKGARLDIMTEKKMYGTARGGGDGWRSEAIVHPHFHISKSDADVRNPKPHWSVDTILHNPDYLSKRG